MDVTDDLVHGNPEVVFFNTYYEGYCYAPLYIFCGKQMLAAKLRASNVDPAGGALEELQRIIKLIRERWPNTKVLVRGDSAYAREDIMAWCESQFEVNYVFGLGQNSRKARREDSLPGRLCGCYNSLNQPNTEHLKNTHKNFRR